MACTQTSFTVSLNVEPILREREKTKNKGLNSGSAAYWSLYIVVVGVFFSVLSKPLRCIKTIA
jgi:hypothetical protein